MCIMADVWPTSPTCWRRPSRIQILSTFGSFHPSGNMWAVREEARSFSVTRVSCVTTRVEDVMPAHQAYHARERELRCVATGIVQELGSSPDLLMVQDCTEQCAPAISYDKLRALLANQPQYFSVMFSITEDPPFALPRKGSKVKDATVHIRQEVFFPPVAAFVRCRCCRAHVLMILTFESCASRPLLGQIMRRLAVFVSPSVNGPPFSYINARDSRLFEMYSI